MNTLETEENKAGQESDKILGQGESETIDLKLGKSEKILVQVPTFTEASEHDDYYTKFLRGYYFPFYLKYHRHILLGWFAVLIITAYFGPSFLSLTKSDLDLPENTPSYIAIKEFTNNYPDVSTWPPAFLVATTTTGNIINENTLILAKELNKFVVENSDIISFVSGYYELISQPQLKLLADQCVSENKKTMLTTVYFKKDAILGQVTKTVENLIEWSHEQHFDGTEVAITGTLPLFNEMQHATEESFVQIDGTVLPIAIVILGFSLASWKHMINAIFNLICTLLLAFAILVPISDPIAINPFSPSIMMSLGIAICFDYTLFMLTRFREEIVLNGKSTEEAVFESLSAAGHVVVVSGFTLFITFMLLLAFPQNFLQSVGWSCGAVVIASVIVNMTLTPAVLLTFKWFSTFEPLPTMASCKACFARTNDTVAPTIQPTIELKTLNEKTDHNKFQAVPTNDEEAAQMVKPSNDTESADLATLEGAADRATSAASVLPVATAASEAAAVWPFTLLPKWRRTFWFYFPFYVCKYPWTALAFVLGVTAPFLWQFFRMVPTSDDNLIYLRGSPSLTSLQTLKDSFPIGRMGPYQVIVNTNTPLGVLTPDYFTLENKLVHQILNQESPKYVSTKSFTALSYFDGTDISFATAMQYLTNTTLLMSSPVAGSYRLQAAPLMNKEKSASLVKIETIVNPNSQEITGFIKDVRRICTESSDTVKLGDKSVKFYLFGGFTTTLDVQDALYELVPVMISTTIIVVILFVALNFGSIMLAARLVFTIFVSLSWTYGFMVIVYQPGAGQDAFAHLTPDLLTSSGIYWIIPVMSFSILVGLALDYDIFLISRLAEFRRMGWSDTAAVCLAIEKTGGIITAAGVIMSISFAGLLLPKSTVLNQYGFSLFIGVAIDTFIVRTIVVPIVISLIGLSPKLNWWPTVMPPILLSHEEEMAALLDGHWVPPISSVTAETKLITADGDL